MLKRIYRKSGIWHPETRLGYIFGIIQIVMFIIYEWRF